jgi:hypothetical protein
MSIAWRVNKRHWMDPRAIRESRFLKTMKVPPRIRLDTVESIVDLLRPVRTDMSWIDIVNVIDLLECCDGLQPPTVNSFPPPRDTSMSILEMAPYKPPSRGTRMASYTTVHRADVGDIERQKLVASRKCGDLLKAVRSEPHSIGAAGRVNGAMRLCEKTQDVRSPMPVKGSRSPGPIVDTIDTTGEARSWKAHTLPILRNSANIAKAPAHSAKKHVVVGGYRSRMRDPVSIETE